MDTKVLLMAVLITMLARLASVAQAPERLKVTKSRPKPIPAVST